MALGNEELYDALENRLPRLFEQGRPRWEREQDHNGRYNVAPRTRAAVIHRDSESGRGMIEEMQWGLIPHWTKHPPSGALNTINARSEGLLDSSSGGMWHALKGYKRCIVPAQGYYEWLKRPSAKVAHFTRLPLGPKDDNVHPPLLFFAGLYDHVKYLAPVESRFKPSEDESDTREAYPTGNPIPLATFTILTTTPSKDIEWLHDRMPCILDTWEDVERWLDLGEMKGWEEGKGGTGELLKGRPGLDCFPVPPEVGKIGKDSPTFIQPVSERSDGIKSFFQKQTTSPAKPRLKTKSSPSPSSRAAGPSSPERKVKAEDIDLKVKAEGIRTELSPEDEEEGLGDDSNAPNSTLSPSVSRVKKEEQEPPTPTSSSKKPKNEESESDPEDKDTSTSLTKRKREEKGGAGHRTKVARKESDEGTKAQPAITNFFKSPQSSRSKPAASRTPATRSRSTKKK